MNKENIIFSSKTIDIAEENDMWLELHTCMCYYDRPNLNGVMLPYAGHEDEANTFAQTLVNMPVQAKYYQTNGEDDLGSHEARINLNGDITFSTESVGVNTEAHIENAEVTTVDGETLTLPCLFSTKRIWKRYPNYISAIKRLFETDNGLGSSWEIATNAYTYENGIKTLTDYAFLGDCLLSDRVTPAYSGTSKAMSLSANDLMVAEALALDVSNNESFNIDNKNEEDNILDKENLMTSEEITEAEVSEDVKDVVENVENAEENTVEETTEVENAEDVTSENVEETVDDTENTEISENTETSEQSETENAEAEAESNDDESTESESETENAEADTTEVETSDLTTRDLRMKIQEACNQASQQWVWLAFMFPEEHYVLCEFEGGSELDFLRFDYSVANNEVTISEPTQVTLTVSVNAINSTVAEYEKTIAEKDELIINSSAQVTELQKQITELSQYKEKFEQAEQEKIANELAEKKDALISSIVKSGKITREEIEASEEYMSYVDNLDKKSLMAIVGERLVASFEAENNESENTVETSSVNASSNLNNAEADEEEIDKVSMFRNYVLNNK